MSSEDFLCVRCARHMRTCCQTREIFVTRGDVRRIAAHTGQDDFFEYRIPDDPSYLDQDDDPEWAAGVFREDNSRRVLKQQATGDCTFLGAAGCCLPLETRPLVCRIYPFDYDAQGLRDGLSHGCPIPLVRPALGLLGELQMERGPAEAWRRQLYTELSHEHDPE